MLAGINSKLRRRNGGGTGHSAASGGGPTAPSASGLSTSLGLTGMPGSAGGGLAGPKIGPQRSTKNAQKLKLLPEPDFGEEGPDEESGRDVYSQYTRIKDPTARRDAARLGKADRARLPRVSAYCTANRYQMDGLFRYLKGRGRAKAGANPKLIDECIYTPYNYGSTGGSGGRNGGRGPGGRPQERRHSTGEISSNGIGRHDSGVAGFGGEPGDDGQDATDWHGSESTVIEVGDDEGDLSIDIEVHTPEVFLFDYGVVVIWGMSLADERRFLKEIAKFETEKLAEEDVETEFFNFYYTREYQARMYNDFIALRDKTNYMTKLAISHALAQSVKVRRPLQLAEQRASHGMQSFLAD